MFKTKTETIKFSDFMDGSYKAKNQMTKKQQRENFVSYALIGLSAFSVALDPLSYSSAYAFDMLEDGIQERIIGAFDPLIQLLQGISYPVAFLMITAGFLLIMTGQKTRGLSMMKYAGVGYIGLQLAPAFMGILVDIGKEMVKQ